MSHRPNLRPPKFSSPIDFALVLRVAIIAGSALVIFSQDLYVIGSDALASSYFNYVLIIPFFILILIYQKRKALSASLPLRDSDSYGKKYLNQTLGFSFLIISLIVYLYGSFTSYPLDYHLISLEIFLGAAVILLFNRRVLRILAVPILFITAALPSVVQFSLGFWIDLSSISAITATDILNVLGFHASLTTTVTVPTIQIVGSNGSILSFVVGVASSGDYSFIGFTLFAAFVAYLAKGPIWKRVVLFLLGYALLPVINIAREVIIIAAAYYWGIGVFNAFHFSSGIILVFAVTLVLLFVGDKAFKLSYIGPIGRVETCPYCGVEKSSGKYFCTYCGRFLRRMALTLSKQDVLAIAAFLLIAIIFVSSLAPSLATANAPSSVNLRTINPSDANSFLPKIPGWSLSYLGEDQYVMDVLDQDAALIYLYTATNATSTGAVPDFQTTIQVSANIHTPEASLIQYPELYGYGQPVNVLADYDTPILSNPPLYGRFFVYQNPGSNFSVSMFYWNLRAVFNLGGYSDYRNVQITLVTYPSQLASWGVITSASDLAGVRNFSYEIAQRIASYWEPQSKASVLQLGITSWGVPAAVLAAVPSGIVAGQTAFENGKAKNTRKTLRGALSEKDRNLLKALEKTAPDTGVKGALISGIKGRSSSASTAADPSTHRTLTPLEQMRLEYQKLSGKEIAPTDLYNSLAYAERAGLVQRQMLEDEAGNVVFFWKEQVGKL